MNVIRTGTTATVAGLAGLMITGVVLAGPGEFDPRLLTELTADDPQETQVCEILGIEEVNRGSYVTWLWEGAVVFYDFDSSVSTLNRNRMRSAMNLVEAEVDVRFFERTTESSYLNIGSFGGNYSYVGQIGGSQDLSMYNWNSPYIICHELIHALGRYHQHQRSDRSAYITVNYENIQESCQGQYTPAGALNYGPYDYDSLMHYGQYSCSTGGPTMTCTSGNEAWQSQMGQRTHISDGDVSTLQFLYPDSDPDALASGLLVPSQADPGDTINVLAAIKNVGEVAGFTAQADLRLSADEFITTDDVLLSQVSASYLMPGGFLYLNGAVTIPASTADGIWYVGLLASMDEDGNATNDVRLSEITIGDVVVDCPGDIDGDGAVNVDDILAIISDFGPCPGCDTDIDGDGNVTVDDLLTALAGWGTCG